MLFFLTSFLSLKARLVKRVVCTLQFHFFTPYLFVASLSTGLWSHNPPKLFYLRSRMTSMGLNPVDGFQASFFFSAFDPTDHSSLLEILTIFLRLLWLNSALVFLLLLGLFLLSSISICRLKYVASTCWELFMVVCRLSFDSHPCPQP